MITAFLVGCGGGGSGDSSSTNVTPQFDEPDNPATVDPNSPTQLPINIDPSNTTGFSDAGLPIDLLKRIATIGRTINGLNFYWACDASLRDSTVGYFFSVGNDFSFVIGSWVNNVDVIQDTFVGSEDFRVFSGTENSLALTYEELGSIEDISNITFASDTNWRGISSTEGLLDCYANTFAAASSVKSKSSASTIQGEAERLKKGSDSRLNKASDGSSGKFNY